MAVLNVNIDHVATIRQVRRADEPDPVWAAAECELAGASGITVHLREDRRHIQDRDLLLLKETVASKLNLEMAVTAAMVRKAIDVRPDQVTLVPEKRAELTTEGGLECVRNRKRLSQAVAQLRKAGIVVSAFITADPDQIAAAADAGCQAIELHTGAYANAKTDRQQLKRLKELQQGRDVGLENGLVVHAGHGLTYRNIGPVAAIEHLVDFNIGHSIVARAVLVGMRQAAREMRELIEKHSPI